MTTPSLSHDAGGSGNTRATRKKLYTSFATSAAHPEADMYMQFNSLDEAIAKIRKWIVEDNDDPKGPMFDRYGVFRGPAHPVATTPPG